MPSLSERVAQARQSESTDVANNRTDAQRTAGPSPLRVSRSSVPPCMTEGCPTPSCGSASSRCWSGPSTRNRVCPSPRPTGARCSTRSPPTSSATVPSIRCSTTRCHRGHGQRPLRHLLREERQDPEVGRPSSSTTSTCAGSSTRSSARSAVASTRPRRWWTPASPTAPVSTRSFPAGDRRPFLTIRKFAVDPFQVADLIRFGTLNPAVGRLPPGLCPSAAQHHHLRWYRLR
jgi:hypothetical protein